MRNQALISVLKSCLCAVSIVSVLTLQAADADLPQAGPNCLVLTGAEVAGGLPVNVHESSDAIGGAYVSPKKQYLPLVKSQLPPEGEVLHVWVHYRDLALQMKTKVGGKTHAFPWNWKRSKEAFVWRYVGAFKRSDIGPELWFINDPKFSEKSGIDALVITASKDWKPAGASEPVSALHPTKRTGPDEESATIHMVDPSSPWFHQSGETVVTIDWTKDVGAVSPMVYGINAFHQFDPKWAGRAEVAVAHAYMQPHLVRIHNGGLVRTWYDEETGTWDREKIKAALSSMPWRGPDAATLININTWPKSFDVDGDRRLDADRFGDYAALCAELVRIVNVELGLGIEYWEVTNEKDFPYWRKPDAGLEPAPEELAAIYVEAAKAMRAVDSNIKIGGPAACNPDPAEPLVAFAVAAQDELDFLSFHSYASGSINESDELIYAKVDEMAANTESLIRMVEAAVPDKAFEYHLNEHNINYSWRVREERMSDEKGAVFDALSLIAFANVPGLTAANAWTDVDFNYGKFSNQGEVRPGAHVYRYFNRLLTGEMVDVRNSSEAVKSFGTIDLESGRRAFVLVNRTNGTQHVTLEFISADGMAADQWSSARVDQSGVFEACGEQLDSSVQLPPHSVSFFWSEC